MKKTLKQHLEILQEDYKKSLEDLKNGNFKIFTALELIDFINNE